MSRSLLFGYSIARDEGKVIVTIEGDMAGEVMSSLSGRRPLCAPSFPFEPLGSPTLGLASLFLTDGQRNADGADEEVSVGVAPNLAEIFGQGFDRGYDEYSARLAAYREILAAGAGAPVRDDGGSGQKSQVSGDPS